LGVPVTTLRNLMKNDLGLNASKPSFVNELSDAQKI
jgi:hypothetical protein